MNIDNFEYIWVFVLIIIGLFLLIVLFNKNKQSVIRENDLAKSLASAGYSYDHMQDIFYSRMDAWQKNFGYCHLYDEAAAPLSMIFDCEPIRFEYENKRWLIELWKGQYGMTTGCEVGVYNTEGPDLHIPGVFNGTFYNCADYKDQLHMSYVLRKNHNVLFKRDSKHWWLTGFKLGEFSEPEELVMDVAVTLKDRAMCNVFIDALRQLGYSSAQMKVIHTTVWIFFDKPYSAQPYTRLESTDRIIQKKNKLLCDTYLDLTKEYDSTPEKINALREKAPDLFNMVLNMGRPLQLYRGYELIKNHIKVN